MKKIFLSLIIIVFSALAIFAQGSKAGRLDMTPGFSRFAKIYVEEHINQWQLKGEFEKTVDYNNRITNQREAKIQEYLTEARNEYIKAHAAVNIQAGMELQRYDADNEAFIITHPDYNDIIVRVSPADAPDFKNLWPQMSVEPSFSLDGDYVVLTHAEFKVIKKGKVKKSYIGTSHTGELMAAAEINYNFEPINLDIPTASSMTTTKSSTPAPTKPTEAIDDVDINIPKGKSANNKNTFAVLIANENYRRVAKVDYAHNDGQTFYNYLTTTLGIPTEQIHLVKDATLNDMRGELEWIGEVGKAYNGNASFIFYYAGHGIPDESTGNGYLLPADGFAARISSALPLSELNEAMAKVESKYSIVMLDACFSGAARSGDMLESARGVVIKARPGKVDSGNLIFVTASKDDETAAKYDNARHGLFTYHLLRKLKDTKGDVNLGELTDYIVDEVNRASIVANRKSQTPTVLVSPSLRNGWSSVKLTDLSK